MAWLVLAASSGHRAALPRIEEVLGALGRIKSLRPLYLALFKDAGTAELARRLFERFQPRYQPIARQVIAALLRETSPVPRPC